MSEITIDIDDRALNTATEVFGNAGLTLEEGINIFLEKVRAEKKLPFDAERSYKN